MCSRFSLTYQIQAAAKRFKFKDPGAYLPPWMPKYNIAPTDETVVVVNSAAQVGDRELRMMVFGLIPSWAKDPKIGLSCLNARVETVTEKPSFREAFRKRRCLVLADGFYEWLKEGSKKLPYRVVLKNREPFAFAGLWDEWRSPQGKTISSFSILTTEPNTLLAPIHNRMPVILPPEAEEIWMDPRLTDPVALLPTLKPYPAEALETYLVSPAVNTSSYKSPDCVAPL